MEEKCLSFCDLGKEIDCFKSFLIDKVLVRIKIFRIVIKKEKFEIKL